MAKPATTTCKRCGSSKEAGNRCMACRKAYRRRRAAEPEAKAKSRARSRAFREKNPNYHAEWRRRNLEGERARKAKWREENREKARKAARDHYARNRTEILKKISGERKNWSPEKRKRLRQTTNAWQKTPGGRASKNASRRRMSRTPDGYAYTLWRRAHSSAKKRGLEFDITPAFLRRLIASGACAVTGIPFDYEKQGKLKARRPFAPSLDRIDPTKGYTKSNVQLVIWAYNAAKGTWSHEEVLRMAKALVAAAVERQEVA